MKKKDGLVKRINQFLLVNGNESGEDRVNITNSPSSALGCSRANYYQRMGVKKDSVDPRVQRIFDNGHGMHERIQGYLTKMGVLMMDEVPLVHEEWEIQGHTDGILSMTERKNEVEILELKSINSRQFSGLRDAKEEHKAQAHVYMFVAEEHRLHLRNTYPTMKDFKRSELSRRNVYRKRYLHLKDGKKYTRDEKIKFKVQQHIQMDNILIHVTKPITKAVLLYECKDTQEMKEFVVDFEDAIIDEVLEKFAVNNEAWKTKKIPCRECTSKSQGRFCAYLSECFPV